MVEILDLSGAELEGARAQGALGAALRRQGQRREARQFLRTALGTAQRLGARPLTALTLEELARSGAKLRREALSGVAALTPAERRVAELASQGLSNPQIAQQLWVSRKTVESQLASVYLKLGNNDRSVLGRLLASDTSAGGTGSHAGEHEHQQ